MLQQTNAKYKQAVNKHQFAEVFKEGDGVVVLLHKQRLLVGTCKKLQQKKYGSYSKTKKIIINLLDNIGVYKALNVSNICLYYDDELLNRKD